MKAIADESGISAGNLTYHFRYKSDLILGIMKDIQTSLEAEMEKDTDNPIEDLKRIFRKQQENTIEFRFYFRNFIEFASDFPEIEESQRKFRKVILDYYTSKFREADARGMFIRNLSEEEIFSYAIAILMCNTLSMENHSPMQDEALLFMDFITLTDNLLSSILKHEAD